MEINLPTTLDGLSAHELMVMTGFKQEFDGSQLPALRVNYDDEDDDGNEIPRGAWALTTEVDNNLVTIFSKEPVFFRPLFNTRQYSHYDADTQKMIAVSVHFQKWGDEVPDSAGGFKCGKVTKKQFEQLTEAEQEVQKKIKLSNVLFGLVTMSGVTRTGNKISVENVPCLFYARGTHYMPIDGFLDKLRKTNTPPQTVVIKFDLERKKNGGVTYWEVVPTTEKDVPFVAADLEIMTKFTETIKAENAQILDKWKKARAKGSKPSQEKLAELIGDDKADNASLELNDEIPF